MSNTSLTTASSPSALPAPSGVGTRNTSLDNPPYTVIQKNGVDVMDLADGIDLAAYPNTEEDEEHGVLLVKGSDWKQNGTNLIDKEPSAVDFITNLPVFESSEGKLEITDVVIKKNGTAVMTGPKKINFLGDMLVSASGDDVIINLSGDGFFGDGLDGDYTLDGAQTAVSGLLGKGSDQSSKSIAHIYPINAVQTDSDVIGTFYDSRQVERLSLVGLNTKIVIDITMDTGFGALDEGAGFVMDSTYLDAQGVLSRQTFNGVISKINSSSQIECTVTSPSDTLLTPISPYRTETVYSLSVSSTGKTSTAQGTLLRPSYSYIETESDFFTSDFANRTIKTTVAETEYTFVVDQYVGPTVATATLIKPQSISVSLSFSGASIYFNGLQNNYITDFKGRAELAYRYAAFVLDSIGQDIGYSAAVVFNSDHEFTSNDIIRISGVTGVDGINGVWRILSLESNIVILIGVTLSATSVIGTGGSAIKLVDYSLQRDAFFDNLTIADNVRLLTNNYRLFVKGDFVVNGVLSNSGGDGASSGYFPSMGTGGAGGAGGITTFPSPQAGSAGSTGASQTNSIFNSSDEPNNGIGGFGGGGDGSTLAGGDGGVYGFSGSSTKITEPFTTRFNLITGNCFTFDGAMFRIKGHASSGGGGGGGVGGFYSVDYVGGVGGRGGKGGDNAGFLLLCAGAISGTGMIVCIGGVGSNGQDGATGVKVDGTHATYSGCGGGGAGGGGGGGGILVLMSRHIESTVTKNVLGGFGGRGGFITRNDPTGVLKAPSGDYGNTGRTGIKYEFIIT